MVKVSRNYVHKDFSYLLKEFNINEKKETEIKIDSKDEKTLDMASRKRSSLLDNVNMLYAYSAISNIIHDRDCPEVKDIADINFRMLEDFDTNMAICHKCYRKALIRNGVGEGRRHIDAIDRFFKNFATPKQLHELLITHDAKLKYIDKNTVEISLNDDSWRIVKKANEAGLWHNNYYLCDDFTRVKTSGFHKQKFPGDNVFRNMLKIMIDYSWEAHVDKLTIIKNKQGYRTNNIKSNQNGKEQFNWQQKRHEYKDFLYKIMENFYDTNIINEFYDYIKNDFDDKQICEIKKGLQKRLAPKQMLIYLYTEYNYKQMRELRKSFFLHLSVKQVRKFADSKLSYKEMRIAKWRCFFEQSSHEIWMFVKYDILKLPKIKFCKWREINEK